MEKGNNMDNGGLAHYCAGYRAGVADAKANKDFRDLNGVNRFFIDGYSRGYRA